MAKADTLAFSRRVKDLIWMEINFISQILGYSKHGPIFVPYSEFPWFCWRISCAIQQLWFPAYSARLQKYMCVCSASQDLVSWRKKLPFLTACWRRWAQLLDLPYLFPTSKGSSCPALEGWKGRLGACDAQPCCPACEFLWGAPKGWQCWHTRSSHCAINFHVCNSLSVPKIAQKF